MAYLQASAEAHVLYPEVASSALTVCNPKQALRALRALRAANPSEVLGLGSAAGWAQLGAKINALRSYVRTKARGVPGRHSLEGQEHVPCAQADQAVVISADAWDVLVLGGGDEILRVFEDLERESGRSLVFNTEPACFPDSDGICEKHPPAKHRWRFLNAGLIVGRVHAFKKMLLEPVPWDINDQWWFQIYRRDHPEEILLDTGCNLTCTLYTIGEVGDGLRLVDGRVHVEPTQTFPPLVHFVSFGHRTRWKNGRPTSYLQETFQKLFPDASARLMERWWLGVHVAATHDLTVYEGEGFWLTMTSFICLQCTLAGVESDDCTGLHGTSTCLWVNFCWFLVFLSVFLAFLAWLLLRGPGCLQCMQCLQCLQCLRYRYAPLTQKPPGLDC